MAVFRKQFDICYSHLDAMRRVRLTALLDFLQDVATAHSDFLGLTLDNMRHDGAFWVLVSFDITLHALPHIDERITAETDSVGTKSVYGYRNFRIFGSDETLLLEASSVWVYMDLKSKRPCRVPAEKAALFAPDAARSTLPRKHALPMPPLETPVISYRVMRRDIDTNAHVNNVKYLELALETLPNALWEAVPSRLELQFLHAATYRDTIDLYTHRTQNESLCALCAADSKEPYAIVRITYPTD